MSTINKLIALLACVTLILGCLVSCLGDTPDVGGEEPQSDKYVANIRIKYATNDAKMKAAIDALSTTSTLTVVGETLKLVTTASVDDISAQNEYIYIDEVLYQSRSVKISDKSVTVLERATIGAEQRDSLISKAGPGAGISIGDFLNFEINTYDDITEYVCSDMLDDSKESLRQIIAESFEGMGAIVMIDSASYRVEIKNDRNQSSVLSCNLVINMDGVDYEVTMHLYYDYDYDAEISISVPENADAYTEVSADEIIG